MLLAFKADVIYLFSITIDIDQAIGLEIGIYIEKLLKLLTK